MIYGITSKTELLGSFSLHVLYARFFADYKGCKLALSENSNINDFSDTGAKDLYLYDEQQYYKHVLYRKTLLNGLITSNEKPNILLGYTTEVENRILEFGFDTVLTFSQKKIRNDVLQQLPNQSYVNPKNIIAIHFRCGEAIYMKGRYIHSSNYYNLIKEFRDNMPDKEIYIFAGKLPPAEYDDLKAFEGIKIFISEENDSPNEIEIWRIFLEAHCFVTARSGFSYTPALLRLPDQLTYYADMWHPKLQWWKTWYTENKEL